MPAWPTLYPTLLTGDSNELLSTKARDMRFVEGMEKDQAADDTPLTKRQK